jgi:hypothetical protein
MKKDLDDPESVEVTDRAARLVEPKSPESGNWKRYRFTAICIAIPFLVFAVAWFFTHFSVKPK